MFTLAISSDVMALESIWEAESLDYVSESGSFDCAGCHHVVNQVSGLQINAPATVAHDANSVEVSLDGFGSGSGTASWRYRSDVASPSPEYGVRPSGGASSTLRTLDFPLSEESLDVRYCLLDADGNERRWNCESLVVTREPEPEPPVVPPVIPPVIVQPPIIEPPVIVLPPVNRRPQLDFDEEVAAELALSPGEEITLAITADDPDGDELGYAVVSTDETVATGLFTSPGSWTLRSLDVGRATVSLVVTDTSGASASLAIDVMVERANQAPLALADNYVVPVDVVSLDLDVLDNDSDPDGDALSIVLDSTLSAQGVALSVVGGSVRYPSADRLLTADTFGYRARDAGGALSSSVQVTVQPSDQDADGRIDRMDNCPVLNNPDQADMDSDGIGDLCDLDPDGDGEPGISGQVQPSGRELVESECLSCHLTGAGGAPVLGDEAAWNARIAAVGGQVENLLDAVVNGIGSMPGFGNSHDTQALLQATYYITGRETIDDDGAGGGLVDPDLDAVDVSLDNCPTVPNPDQTDSNGNGVGDDCEPLADRDGDGFVFAIDDDDGNARRLPAELPDTLNTTVVISDRPLSLGRLARVDAEARSQQQVSWILDDARFIDSAAGVFPGVDVSKDAGFGSLMGVINLEAASVDDAGSVQMTLSLASHLPLNPQVLSLAPVNGGWVAVDEAFPGAIASAAAGDTGCPSADSPNFQPGLMAAMSCVSVTVSDGSALDADGVVNGRVEVILDIGRALSDDVDSEPPPVQTNPGKGGGRLHPGLLILLSVLLLSRLHGFMRSRR